MIKHIVLFKLKDISVDGVKKANKTLLSMKGKIMELKKIEVGIDITRSDRSYDIVLITRFENIQDLKAYQMNPLHMEVADYMVSVAESIVVVDYET